MGTVYSTEPEVVEEADEKVEEEVTSTTTTTTTTAEVVELQESRHDQEDSAAEETTNSNLQDEEKVEEQRIDDNHSHSNVEDLRNEIRALQARVDALTFECQSPRTDKKNKEIERWNHAQFNSLIRQVQKLEQQQQQQQQNIQKIVEQRVQEALEDQFLLHMDRFYKMIQETNRKNGDKRDCASREVPQERLCQGGTQTKSSDPTHNNNESDASKHDGGNGSTSTSTETGATSSSRKNDNNDDDALQKRMDQFWEETRHLEEHLSKQFAEHEGQFATNESIDQLVVTFDEQLAEVLDMVQDHMEEQQCNHDDLRNQIQRNQRQQAHLQQQVHAMQEKWKQKVQAFRKYLNDHQPESMALWQDLLLDGAEEEKESVDENYTSDQLATIDQPNLEMVAEWKEQMKEWSTSIRAQIEELQMVREAHDQMHADMQLQTESVRLEFHQFLENIRGQARVAQTMHDELVRIGETSRAEMDENSEKIEILDNVLQELARRTQMQAEAIKVTKDSLQATCSEAATAESTREMVQELRNELDETKALLTITVSKQSEMLRAKECKAKQNILDSLGKHKSRLRELLSEDDCASIMVSEAGIEVGEFRDVASPFHFGSASNESFYFSRDAETTTTLSYE